MARTKSSPTYETKSGELLAPLPLFLQFKQALQSLLEYYAGASPYAHAGQRVVVGQRQMLAAGESSWVGIPKVANGTFNIMYVNCEMPGSNRWWRL